MSIQLMGVCRRGVLLSVSTILSAGLIFDTAALFLLFSHRFPLSKPADVWRQRDAEVVAENIQASGVSGGVVVYHGGMDSTARAKAQSRVGDSIVCAAI